MKRNRLAALVCLWACFQPYAVLGCGYNVREIGFVDLGDEPYRFYGYVTGDTPPEIRSAFAEISCAVITQSNVTVEILCADKQNDHPAMKYLNVGSEPSFPVGVLVSPDGRPLAIPVPQCNQPFGQTLRLALDDIVSSPKRDEILQKVTKVFAVVLLIEGTDAEENARARQAVAGAIKRIGERMKGFAEPAPPPPVFVAIDRQSFPEERVLLWSLGLDVENANEPHAAVIYGRMRWIGPLMKGSEISEANVSGILSIIGARCECGFDISWTRGTLLPTRWDEETQALAARGLGFDPENPMVKMEASGILARGFSSADAPFGYVELVAEAEAASEAQEMSLAEHPVGILSDLPPGDAVSQAPPRSESALLQMSLRLMGGLAVFVVCVGLLILFRAARRKL